MDDLGVPKFEETPTSQSCSSSFCWVSRCAINDTDFGYNPNCIDCGQTIHLGLSIAVPRQCLDNLFWDEYAFSSVWFSRTPTNCYRGHMYILICTYITWSFPKIGLFLVNEANLEIRKFNRFSMTSTTSDSHPLHGWHLQLQPCAELLQEHRGGRMQLHVVAHRHAAQLSPSEAVAGSEKRELNGIS